MKQVMISGGAVTVQDVPAPILESGKLLIQLDHSCISIGTEISGIKSTGRSLIKRVMQQPQNVKKVLDLARTEGIKHARQIVTDSMSIELPTGYSASGRILEVGKGVNGYVAGDRVACAGSQCAFHAEIVSVPENLVVKIPENVGFDEASSVALGAIAMQGVRRANPTIGETFVVVGLGVLGQLTTQILKANGCKVIGIDLDKKRLDLAKINGLNLGINPEEIEPTDYVKKNTNGNGVDGVIITAAGTDEAILSNAFKMCRKKARVVLVGDVPMHINREDIYIKEIDFYISSSYGPGRYDLSYEEDGNDYPISYVRWTEKRNMEAYLDLISDSKINVKSMISSKYEITSASDAYSDLSDVNKKPLMVLFEYSNKNFKSERKIIFNANNANKENKKISVGMIGVGNYVKTMYLPNIKEMQDHIEVKAVVSRSGVKANSAAKSFNAYYSTTNVNEVLEDKGIDAVIISTRHDSHAELAIKALESGKHVLVEKPLALEKNEIRKIEEFYESELLSKPQLMTGFNRRFSPVAKKIKSLVENRNSPLVINYTMNAGYIPLDHWVHGKEGGGRNRGEACHIYDLFTYLIDSRVSDISALNINSTTKYYSNRDNFTAILKFEDGSIANLTYTSMGDRDYSKEVMQVYFDGLVISMDDYKKIKIFGKKEKQIESRTADKGQKEALAMFIQSVRKGEGWPIPLWQQIQATKIANAIEDMIVG